MTLGFVIYTVSIYWTETNHGGRGVGGAGQVLQNIKSIKALKDLYPKSLF